MKAALSALVLLTATAGCGSSVDIIKPQIDLAQLYAPTDLGYARGSNTMVAKFAFRVINRSTEPITLRRVNLQSSGDGGYYLQREDRTFKHQIGPGQAVEDTMDARAYFRTTVSGTASTEPVTLRATFYFDSPVGSFRQIVIRNIGQFSDGPR
ncbi:MAG TPA: hypothetical protein VFT12_10640 [Thermoanaerobaculia bacterium]|nr:hypothetical protein [Thermoanaerobaculia bacterium]